MSDHLALLWTSYETVTFGDAFFGGMAEGECDEGRREKLRLLQEIVSHVAAWLLSLVERENGAVDRTPGLLAGSLGHSAVNQGWAEMMKGLHEVGVEILATFVRCRETAPDPDHPALIEPVRSQQVIMAFTDLESTGHSDVPGAALARYLETVR